MKNNQMSERGVTLQHTKTAMLGSVLKSMVIAAVGFVVSAYASPVEIYSNAVWVAGDGSAQVETIGFLKYAYSAYNSGTPGTLVVNGKEGKTVAFTKSNVSQNTVTNALDNDITFNKNVTRAARADLATAITDNYQLALRDIYYTGATPTSYSMTLKNLTVGRTYLVQVWASDGGTTSDREVKFTLTNGAEYAGVQLDINNGNALKKEGQVATFKTVADGTSMTLALNSAGTVNNFACFSAIQVRDITPMYWSTGTGNWNATGTNWDPADDTETIWSSTTGIGVNANFTNNALVTLTSDVWARDVNIISNTTIKRVTSGTTTLTVMRNVTIDSNRTLAVGIGTSGYQTVIAVSNGISGALDIKAYSRIVLGNGALGQATAAIDGSGGNNFGAIQTVDNGVAEWSGQLTTVAATRIGAGISGILTVSGRISGSTLTIRSANTGSIAGLVVLSNSGNNYNGDTTIYTPLRIGCNNAIPVASKWAFGSSVMSPSLDLNGNSQEVQSFTGTIAGSNITNSHATASVLTVSNTSVQDASALRLIGNFSVIKKGSAKLTLGVTNTYSGTTTVVAGTLALNALGDIAETEKLILAGGTFDVSAKTGYSLTRPLQVTTNSSIVGTLTMGATTELAFDGTSVALAGGTILLAGQTLKLTTTATLMAGTDYLLISGYSGDLPTLDATALTIPEGATASLILAGGTLKLSVVSATTPTTMTLGTVPTDTVDYGTNIIITATISPPEVPNGGTVNLYAASDLETIIDSGLVSGRQAVFTIVKPTIGTYSYVAKYMGGGVYAPTQSVASADVTIQAKTLIISDINADKIFDGMTNVTPRYAVAGVVVGETNPITCVAYYLDPDVGTLKTVTLKWIMPNLNYVISGDVDSIQGTIFESAVWTGTAGDNLWQTTGNWANNLVPNSTDVAALFNTDVTVSLSTDVNIKKITFNGNVTLNGPGTFTFPPQYVTGEVVVASSKIVIFNALVALAYEGIPKKGLGTLILMGNHGFVGKLNVLEGIVEINQTTAGALAARDYTTAENATLRFICAAIGSAGTQLPGIRSVTGDGIFEVASGYLRIQSSNSKVSVSMGDKGQIIVRDGAFMNNNGTGGDRFLNNKAKLVVEGAGLFGLTDDTVKVGSLHGDGQVKSEAISHTLSIMGNTDGMFSGILTEKDAAAKLMLAKWGLGTQILSGTNSYTGATTIYGGCLTLAGGTNRLSVNTPVTVTNAVLNLGLTQQTFNTNPIFRAGSKLAVDVSKTETGCLTLTNNVDVSSWAVMINNPNDYPKGKKFAVITTGTDKIITGAPTLVDKPAGFRIYNQNNTIYIDSFGTLISFF